MNANQSCLLPDQRAVPNTRHVFLIIRMAIDPQGQLAGGTLVDAQGVTLGCFRQWADLLPLLDAWWQVVTATVGKE
ncbi:MAG: hypothetical protein R3E79_34670 [Caldilineaceae bacterium]